MMTLLTELERNIDAELGVQMQVQELLDRQLDILLHGKTRALGEVLAEAEQGLARSSRLEGERQQLLARIAEATGIPARELTMARLEEALGAVASPLVERGAELKECLNRIRETNRRVALLLRHSVLFIDDLIAAVNGGAPRASAGRTYTRVGAHAGPVAGQLAAEA